MVEEKKDKLHEYFIAEFSKQAMVTTIADTKNVITTCDAPEADAAIATPGVVTRLVANPASTNIAAVAPALARVQRRRGRRKRGRHSQ